MVELLFSVAASDDYRGAFLWYEERSPRAAARFEAEVEWVLSLIQSHPQLFPILGHECRSASLRKFPFLIIYRAMGDHLEVVSVAHASQSDERWLGRL